MRMHSYESACFLLDDNIQQNQDSSPLNHRDSVGAIHGGHPAGSEGSPLQPLINCRSSTGKQYCAKAGEDDDKIYDPLQIGNV